MNRYRSGIVGLIGALLVAMSAISVMAEEGATVNVQALRDMGNSVSNVGVVSPRLVRGGQPTAEGLTRLKKAGVKTIVDLRNEPVMVAREERVARRLGLNFVNIPLDVFSRPSASDIKRFLATVNNSDNQPVFVHCLHGQDRTGAMVALYRIHSDNWDGKRAYDEMLSFGFHPLFTGLSDVVFDESEKLGHKVARPPQRMVVRDLKERVTKLLDH